LLKKSESPATQSKNTTARLLINHPKMVQGANWLNEEDAQLARSWLHTSQNPTFANSMKRNQFW
jgi:hypothetical protein